MKGERYLSPRLLQGLGVLLLIVVAVFWMITGRESALLMGAAMSLIGLGAYQGVQIVLKRPDESPTPPPVAPHPDDRQEKRKR